MTKQSYAQQVANVPLVANWDDELSFVEKLSYKLGRIETRKQAEKIAKEADEEILKLKGLLDTARWLLHDSGCKNFIDEIEKALYD